MVELAQGDRLILNGWRGWLALFGGWAAPALIVVAGTYTIGAGYGPRDPGWVILATQLAYYWFFACLTPLVYRLDNRVSWSHSGWPLATAAHLGTAILALSFERVVQGLVEFTVRRNTETLLESIQEQLTSPAGQWRGLVSIFYYVLVVATAQLVRQRRARRRERIEIERSRLRLAQAEAELARVHLDQLEQRLNPHFLFNALNSIASLVRRHSVDDAYRAIELLGTLLRRNLDPRRPDWLSVAEELDFLESYLEMERLRFGDRLQTRIDAEPETLPLTVPAMILQPLVENAVRHGIARRPEASSIEVRVRRHGEGLHLEVRDDGAGIAPEADQGLGLRLVRERLATHYEGAASFQLVDADGHGAIATLVLP